MQVQTKNREGVDGLCVCRPSQAVSGAAAQLRVDAAAYSSQLHAAFAQLVRERCVERCKPCDLPRVAPRVGTSCPRCPSLCSMMRLTPGTWRA